MKAKSIVGKILTIVGIVLTVGLIVAATTLVYQYILKDYFAYNTAKKLMEEKSFSEAYEIFDELGGYNDSITMLKQCEYEMALDLLEKGKYSAGYRKLEKLGSFNDAVTYKNQHIYDRATVLLESDKLEEAKELFAEIKDFGDSADMIKECRYREAKKYFAEKDFTNSNPIFAELGDYKDSANLVHEKHKYELVSEKKATCYENGYKEYVCACGHTDGYEIQKQRHEYTKATCNIPETCKHCGDKRGNPKGHDMNYVVCPDCLEVTFEGRTYSGTGNKTVNFDRLPIGAYKITFTVTAPAGKKISASVNFYNKNSYLHSVLCDADATKSLSSVKKSTVKETLNAYNGATRIIVNCGTNSDAVWEVKIEAG